MYNKRNIKNVETYIPRQYYIILMDVFTGPIKMCTEHQKNQRFKECRIQVSLY
jgi:hypothetical protein